MENVYNAFLSNLKYNDVIVVAVSGGIDSMVLLHLLVQAKKNIDIKIICGHVNHNVRSESKTELEFVKKYCEKNEVIFESMIIENYGDDNFHNEARNIRYDYFESIIKKYNAKFLFTAHHADDLVETIMMRMMRGSTLKGYAGFKREIKKNNYTLVRPLIYISKKEIEKYAKSKRLNFVQDNSNFSDKYTRNRYRANILPFFESEDSNFQKKFNKFSELLMESSEFIDKHINKIVKEVYKEEILNIDLFKEQEEFIQKKILYYIVEHKYQDDLILINDRHINLIMELINSKKTNGIIHLPNEILVEKTYGSLYFKDEVEISDYEIEIDSYVTLPNNKVIEKVSSSKIDSNFVCRLSSKQVKLPLYVRNKRDGDKMTVKGMLGSKKIADIFINKKIKPSQRDKYPVVCDSNGNIIWLPGIKKSKFSLEKDEKYDIILKYY